MDLSAMFDIQVWILPSTALMWIRCLMFIDDLYVASFLKQGYW